MVRFFLFILIHFFSLSLVGQGNCDTVPFRHWVAPPIFDKSAKNSIDKLFEFILVNFKYPETAKADKIEGKVIVEFWIDTDGYTSEHRIIQSVRQDLDGEVLRVAKNSLNFLLVSIFSGQSENLVDNNVRALNLTNRSNKKSSKTSFSPHLVNETTSVARKCMRKTLPHYLIIPSSFFGLFADNV